MSFYTSWSRLHSYNAILSWISLDCVNKWWSNDLNMELVPHLHFNRHNPYVMCVYFHLKKDLVICGSLKQMVWIWDIGTLQRKGEAPFEDLHVWDKWMIISLEVGMLWWSMNEVSTKLLFIPFSFSLFQLLTITKWNFGTWMICVFKHFSIEF
jgi:WD40 repeat protein